MNHQRVERLYPERVVASGPIEWQEGDLISH